MAPRFFHRVWSIAGMCNELIVAGVLVLTIGCAQIGTNARGGGDSASTERVSTTHLTAMRLGSRTPLLPSFIVRLAQSELPLKNGQAKTIATLVADADEATRPIDDARVVFLEMLAQSVQEGAVRPVVQVAADRVVRATEQATPELLAILEELHTTLTPSQRTILVEIVNAKLDAWTPFWEWPRGSTTTTATTTTTTTTTTSSLEDSRHRWVLGFSNKDIRSMGPAVEHDTTELAKSWTTQLITRVATDLPNLDLADKRRLIIRLRTDSWSN